MRQIKFRGKRLDNGKWIVGDLLQSNEGSVYIGIHGQYIDDGMHFNDMYNETCFINDETIGQFTGFTDCVTRKIYEDDILHFERYGKNYTALVKWNNEVGAWCMQLRYEPCCGCRPLSEWLNEERLEVIGNIHDNPELFKGGKQ